MPFFLSFQGGGGGSFFLHTIIDLHFSTFFRFRNVREPYLIFIDGDLCVYEKIIIWDRFMVLIRDNSCIYLLNLCGQWRVPTQFSTNENETFQS